MKSFPWFCKRLHIYFIVWSHIAIAIDEIEWHPGIGHTVIYIKVNDWRWCIIKCPKVIIREVVE